MSQATFVTGSLWRHVVEASLTASLGLMAIFLVDLLDMLFLSMLEDVEIVSAVGYSASILFFTTSLCIGLSIAMGALVSQSVGAGNLPRARRLMMNVFATSLLLGIGVGGLTWWWVPELVALLGATGREADLATLYLRIMIPSLPILALGIPAGAVLRAVGDHRRAMWATLLGGLVNAVLDPIFIFVFDGGIAGAAIASVIARFTVFGVGLFVIVRHHHLLCRFCWAEWAADLAKILGIAVPAILTNVATPISTAYVTAAMAPFGAEAVAGLSVISRLTPFAFGVVFAASGAIGPIIGQNYGAGLLGRVWDTLSHAYLFVFGVVAGIALVLLLGEAWVVQLFRAEGQAAALVGLFCSYLALTYAFAGATMIGNAAFNNLGYPHYSTLLNFGKATVGTVPFVYFGAAWLGAEGVLIGQACGHVLFGILSVVGSYLLLRQKKVSGLQLAAE